MNYYYLGERDQARASWVLFEVVRKWTKHAKDPALPPIMYRFLGPPLEGDMRIKAEYLRLCCEQCGRYDEDAVYKVGFSEPVHIAARGDFTHTQDRVFIVNGRFLNALRNGNVQGYETKPLGSSGWYAFQVNRRVRSREGVIKLVEPICPTCKRAKTTTGMFECLSQLSVPKSSNTFFTTEQGWPSMLWDLWIFATEDVVQTLKMAGVKGGYFNRLWTDEEVRRAEESVKQGRKWKPPASTVML